ncbi:hypothetical protein Dxin01_02924 [Deinococcus xinjiangensis]|uniref:Uncharacterized protein n=1 Tax=Deinococcus xinjiangensis TaxID=457454 RepID=A0ABP9VD64_9DEIO
MKKLVLLGVLLAGAFGVKAQAWVNHAPAPVLADEGGSRPIGG